MAVGQSLLARTKGLEEESIQVKPLQNYFQNALHKLLIFCNFAA